MGTSKNHLRNLALSPNCVYNRDFSRCAYDNNGYQRFPDMISRNSSHIASHNAAARAVTNHKLARHFLCILILPLFITILTGCIEWLAPAPDTAPSGVTATEGTENDRILIEWNEVSNAGVYFIYRADQENGEYEYQSSTVQSAFIDVTIAPEVYYWYIVASANILGDTSTEKRSTPVRGKSRHDFAWSQSSLGFSTGQIGIVADRDISGEAFSVALDSTDGTDNIEVAVSVSRYVGNGWSDVGSAFGIANGSISGSAALGLRASVPYVAYIDEGAGGKVTVQKYSESDEEDGWISIGNPGQGNVSSGSLSMAVSDTHVYVAGIVGLPGPETIEVLAQSNTPEWQTLDPPAAGALVTTNAILRMGPDDMPYIAYEDETSSFVRVKKYDGAVWAAVAEREIDDAAAGSEIAPSYFAFDIDASGNLFIAYFNETAGELHVITYTGAVWSDITPAGLSADSEAGSVGLSVDADTLYLFYRDASTEPAAPTNRGVIRTRNAAGTWSIIPLSEEQQGITGQYNVKNLRLDVYNNRIFAAYIEGSGASARVYK